MSQRVNSHQRLTGRGALSNPAGRFEPARAETVDDGWYVEEQPDSVATSVQPDTARRVITRNDSPDIKFEQSINPYRGCEHGCIYCYARPSHAYMGLSAGIDFETRLFYKADAGRVLEQELADPRYVCKSIMLGANTDPYQPVERRLRVTRDILEVLARTHHPVSIISKSAMVLRDLDLLVPMAREGLVNVSISITTLDNETKRVLEPRTAAPQARLRTLRELHAAGIPTAVMVAPVIPAITDHEMEDILAAAAAAGASWAGYVLLRLPFEIKDLFREWLAEHFPQRAAHVMSLVQDMRGGKDYDASFGTRMIGTGPMAELLGNRFRIAVRRLGLNVRARDPANTALFQRPRVSGSQLTLGF